MPTQVTRVTTLYTFAELSDKAKEVARSWWRRSEDEDPSNFWSESVYADAETFLPLMGFTLRRRDTKLMSGKTRSDPCIFWSGFSSQGDGACFEATWRASDVQEGKAAEYAPQDTVLQACAATLEAFAAANTEASFTVCQRGHYYHSQSIEYDFDGGEEEISDTDERNARDACRALMDWIYNSLQKEYDYSMSDEQVDEAINANEYTFTESGKRSDG